MGTKLRRSLGAMRPGFRSVAELVIKQNKTKKKQASLGFLKTSQILSPRQAPQKAGRTSRQPSRQPSRLSHNNLRKSDRASRQEKSQEHQSRQETSADNVSIEDPTKRSEQQRSQATSKQKGGRRGESTERPLKGKNQQATISQRTESRAGQSRSVTTKENKQAESRNRQMLQVPDKPVGVKRQGSTNEASPRHTQAKPMSLRARNESRDRQKPQTLSRPGNDRQREVSRERYPQQVPVKLTKETQEGESRKQGTRQANHAETSVKRREDSKDWQTNKAKNGKDKLVQRSERKGKAKQQRPQNDQGHQKESFSQENNRESLLPDTETELPTVRRGDKERQSRRDHHEHTQAAKQKIGKRPARVPGVRSNKRSVDSTIKDISQGQTNQGSDQKGRAKEVKEKQQIQTDVKEETKKVDKENVQEQRKAQAKKVPRRKWVTLAQLVAQSQNSEKAKSQNTGKAAANEEQESALNGNQKSTLEKETQNNAGKAKNTLQLPAKAKTKNGKLTRAGVTKRVPISYRRNDTSLTQPPSRPQEAGTTSKSPLNTDTKGKQTDKHQHLVQNTKEPAGKTKPGTQRHERQTKVSKQEEQRSLFTTEDEDDMTHPLNRTMTLLKGYSDIISADASGEKNQRKASQASQHTDQGTIGQQSENGSDDESEPQNQDDRKESDADIEPEAMEKLRSSSTQDHRDINGDRTGEDVSRRQSDLRPPSSEVAKLPSSTPDQPSDPPTISPRAPPTPPPRPSTATARRQQQQRRQKLLAKLVQEAKRRESGQPSPVSVRRLPVVATPSPTPSVAGAGAGAAGGRSPRLPNLPRVRLDSDTSGLRPN